MADSGRLIRGMCSSYSHPIPTGPALAADAEQLRQLARLSARRDGTLDSHPVAFERHLAAIVS